MPDAFDTEEHAAEWLVRLDADSSEETLASWAKWLREDARHHAAYVRVEEGWRQAECLKSLRPLDGTVRAELLDEVGGSRPAEGRPWRALAPSHLPAPYIALAVALGAGALASLLVLAGWRLLVTTP